MSYTEPEEVLNDLPNTTKQEGECELWQGSLDAYGVPIVRMNGRKYSGRKIIFEAVTGEVTEHRKFSTRCGYSNCLNPEHIVEIRAESARRREESDNKKKQWAIQKRQKNVDNGMEPREADFLMRKELYKEGLLDLGWMEKEERLAEIAKLTS